MLGGLFGKKIGVVSDGGIFSKLRDLLQGAQQRVVLVAPYLDPNDDLVRQLKAALDRKVDVEIWFREDKVSEYRRETWFEELAEQGVIFKSIENLHAKIYVFDQTYVVSSMNLTKTSWNNSREIGFVLPEGDASAEEIEKYLKALGGESHEVATTSKSKKPAPRSNKPAKAAAQGHCIRCNDDIPFNPERPYCKEDYAQWAEYSNEDYRDKFCHGCGEATPATMKRPLCRECYAAS